MEKNEIRNQENTASGGERREWKTAEDIRILIEQNHDGWMQFEEDPEGYALFVRFDEHISGDLMKVILEEIPNPMDIHIKKGIGLNPPSIELGFRLKEVEI